MRLIGLLCLALSAGLPASAGAQSPAPCELGSCALLGLTAVTVGTGATVAYGRKKGGVSTMREGLTVWSLGFGSTAVAGIALGGDKGRQNRAVYASALGAIAGAAAGVAIERLGVGGDDSGGLAAGLIGAAAGALVGGVLGAISYESDANPVGGQATYHPALVVVRLGF